ncbi:PucR family transcriptional regulator [Mycobacterium sp. SMC-18]|uniref:PucR family transcriptional regulator n=1 Tax=unclassified Mycobacterium TaxID=2642494 RepID=UPI0038771F67
MDVTSTGTKCRSPGIAIGTMLGELPTGLLNLAVAPRDPNQRITSAALWESPNPSPAAPDTIVFAVGVEPHRMTTLMTTCGGALVVSAADPWLRRQAEAAGLALFVLGPGVTADRAVAVLRGALAAAGDQPAPHPWDGSSDLLALADSAALTLGVQADVTDHRLRLLAFSSLDDETEVRDPLRVDTILGRRIPDRVSSWLRDSGQFTGLAQAAHPVRIAPPGHLPRWVLPLRTGPEIIGYLWLLPPSGALDPAVAHDAVDIAQVLTARLTRAALTDNQRQASDLLRGVLDGRVTPETLTSAWAPRTSLRLIGFRSRDNAPMRHVDSCHLESLVAMRFQANDCAPIVATVGATVYALLDTAPIDTAHLRSLTDDIVARAARQLGSKLVAVIGGVRPSLTELSSAGAEVDRALRVQSCGTGADVVALEDISTQCVLHELAELTEQRPHLLAGCLDVLSESDRTKNTAYLETLQAYFDANCDLADAASAMYLHRNTIRYRLQRIHDICNLDLEDPVDRLVTEIQLRLLRIRRVVA